MAWALVANTIAGDGGTTSSVTTSSISTTGSNLIVIGIARDQSSNATNLTDNQSNVWKFLYSFASGAVRVEQYYCINPITSATHTFSNTGSFNFSSLSVSAYSGNAPEKIIDLMSFSGNTATTVLPGSITPSKNNELIVCTCGFTGTGSTPLTINDSFTKTNELDFSSGVYYGSGMAYKIQTTAAASSPTWTKTGSTPFASIQTSFKLSPEVSVAWTRS